MFRFIDLFPTDNAVFSEKVGTRTYWVFESGGRYPFTTLITSKIGNKDGGYYGWSTKEKALEYIKEKVQEAKNSIVRKLERKKENSNLAQKKFDEIEIGEIYVSSWGYEAVWYEFYQVVDKKSGWVYLQKLGKDVSYDNANYGYCSEGCVKPNEKKDGEIIKRKVTAYGFKGGASFEYCCSKYNPNKTYEEGNWH